MALHARPASSRGSLAGWVLLFAILAAWLLDDLRAGWLGAFAGYLFGRLLALEQALADLRTQLERDAPPASRADAVRAAATADDGGAGSGAEVGAEFGTEATAEVGSESTMPAAAAAPMSPSAATPTPWPSAPPAADPVTAPAVEPQSPSPSTSPWSSTAPDMPSAPGLRERIEAWLGRGNPIARLGVLITFFGAVYLIKYAAAEGWLPIEWRLAGLAVAALAMVATGWRLRQRVQAYALTLQGGGLALLYLTVLAAFRYYALLPGPTALALLVLVAAASAVLALRQDALALAMIGFAGGFVAPLAIGGDGNHVALFGYYAVLNLGLLAIAARRAWRPLNLLGFVFTFVITALWRAQSYRPELFASTEFFLLLFFALYLALSLLAARAREADVAGLSGLLNFGLPAVVLSLQVSIVRELPDGLAWSALGFGLFYLALAGLLRRIGDEPERSPMQAQQQAFLAIGVVLVSLAVPLRYDAQATASTWALEGAGAVWLGVRQVQWRARAFGILIQLCAGGALLFGAAPHVSDEARLASGVTGALLLASAGALSGVWLYRAAERLLPRERGLDRAALVWALLWWFDAALTQIDHLAVATAPGLRLVLAAVTALLLDVAAQRLAWSWLRTLATLVILPFAWFATADALARHPLAAGGVYGWPALFAAHYALLWRRERRPLAGAGAVTGAAADSAIGMRFAPGLHAGALWLIVLLFAQELAWQIDRTRPDDWVALAWGLAPALVLLPLALGQPRWPVARHATIYRLWAAAPVATGLLAWMLLTSLDNAGDAAPLPTWPLLNPLDVTVAGVLAVLALWWQSLAEAERTQLRTALPAPAPRWLLPGAVAFVVFVWLNSALVRGLHYTLGTPIGAYGIRHSALVQAAFSIFWSLLGFGAMLAASRRRQREAWLAGAGLMLVVALKLFIVDTAGTGTLARIVAFLGVGVLLLVTGYLAPLPPGREPGREPRREPAPETDADR